MVDVHFPQRRNDGVAKQFVRKIPPASRIQGDRNPITCVFTDLSCLNGNIVPFMPRNNSVWTSGAVVKYRAS